MTLNLNHTTTVRSRGMEKENPLVNSRLVKNNFSNKKRSISRYNYYSPQIFSPIPTGLFTKWHLISSIDSYTRLFGAPTDLQQRRPRRPWLTRRTQLIHTDIDTLDADPGVDVLPCAHLGLVLAGVGRRAGGGRKDIARPPPAEDSYASGSIRRPRRTRSPGRPHKSRVQTREPIHDTRTR